MITYDSADRSTLAAYQPTLGLQGLSTTSSSPAPQAATEDTVKLSTTAQVSALHTNGMSVKQIAASIGDNHAGSRSIFGYRHRVKRSGRRRRRWRGKARGFPVKQ